MIALPALIWMCRWVLGQVMHIMDVLSVMEYYNPEMLHNIIANIFYMVLQGALMLPPHNLTQLEPQLFIKVAAPIWSQV